MPTKMPATAQNLSMFKNKQCKLMLNLDPLKTCKIHFELFSYFIISIYFLSIQGFKTQSLPAFAYNLCHFVNNFYACTNFRFPRFQKIIQIETSGSLYPFPACISNSFQMIVSAYIIYDYSCVQQFDSSIYIVIRCSMNAVSNSSDPKI